MLQPRQPCLLRHDWHRRHTRALRVRQRPLRQQRWLLLRLASLDLLLLDLSSLDLLLLLHLSSRSSRHHSRCPPGLCNLLLDGRRSLVLLAGTTVGPSALLCSHRGSLPCLLLCGVESTTLC